MNALDIIVLAAIGLSALFAFVRGFVREALSLVSWVGAAAVTRYGFSSVQPFFRSLISSQQFADIAAGTALFVVSLIVLSILTGLLSSRVRDSSLNALDRSLGLLFGVVRGAAVVCLAYMGIVFAIPEADRPEWFRQARTLPMLNRGAIFLRELIPGDVLERGAVAAEEAQRIKSQAQSAAGLMQPSTASTAKSASPPPPAPVYKTDDQKKLDQLFQSTTQ
jgi:membrane protein required for colicin V production